MPPVFRDQGRIDRAGLLSRLLLCVLFIALAPATSAGLQETQRAFPQNEDFGVTDAALQFDSLAALIPSSWRAEQNDKLPLIIPAKPFALSFAGPGASSRFLATDCLTAAVYYEAANEPITGQRAVAQVVLNRLRHPAYPNTVCGVVFQGSERKTGCQFTFTCDGSLRRYPAVGGWLRARAVAAAALSGYVEPSVGHATHYHATYVRPYWAANLVKLDAIASHVFYRWPGKAGTASAFIQHYGAVESIPAGAASALSSLMLAVPSAAIAGNALSSSEVQLENALTGNYPNSGNPLNNAPLQGDDGAMASRNDMPAHSTGLIVPTGRLKDSLSRSALIFNESPLLN